MNNKNLDMRTPQPRLGRKGMIALIALCTTIAPLSTDMYMPALPEMAGYFHTDDTTMNMTLACFFLFFAVGMLIFGPISDRRGRRPVILFGVLLYILSSVACGLALNVYFLILMRCLQALGAGCLVAVSTAIVKDQFKGRTQGTVLAISQSFSVLGPVISPLLGAQIYRFFSWRADFYMQAIITIAILILVLLMKDTLPAEDRLDVGVLKTFGRLGKVLSNRTFTCFMCCIILIQIPMMAYISASSYIYENQFGLSSTDYSLYFAATALASILGPGLYIYVRKYNAFSVTIGIFGSCLLFGVLIMLFGHIKPLLFALCFAPIMITSCTSRPFATAILLNLQKHDTGSASSLSNFSFTLSGAVGMFLVTSLWNDYITGLSVLAVAAGVTGMTIALLLRWRLGKDSLDI